MGPKPSKEAASSSQPTAAEEDQREEEEEERVVRAAAHSLVTTPPVAAMASMIPDVCALMVEFLLGDGAGRGDLKNLKNDTRKKNQPNENINQFSALHSLSLVNTIWHRHVVYSPFWERRLKAEFPATHRRILSQLNGDSVSNSRTEKDFNWMPCYGAALNRYRHLDNEEQQGGSVTKQSGGGGGGGGGWGLRQLVSSVFSSRKVPQVMLLGIDNVGKTTMAYASFAQFKEPLLTGRTIGFSVEDVFVMGMRLVMWDVGGQEKIRVLWKHYFEGTCGLIWMIDGADPDRLEESRYELSRIITEPTLSGHDIPLLVLVNKQDLPQAVSVDTVTEVFRLDDEEWVGDSKDGGGGSGDDDNTKKSRKRKLFRVQGCSLQLTPQRRSRMKKEESSPKPSLNPTDAKGATRTTTTTTTTSSATKKDGKTQMDEGLIAVRDGLLWLKQNLATR